MKKVCCSNGHYFDADKFTICPICHPPLRETQNNLQQLDNPQAQPEGAGSKVTLNKAKRKT